MVIGFLGLATYIFTAIFVYMSEKDLEHHIATTRRIENEKHDTYSHAPESPPILPDIARRSRSSNGSVCFEQFRKDGFIEIDLERQAGLEIVRVAEPLKSTGRKKPRLTLFN